MVRNWRRIAMAAFLGAMAFGCGGAQPTMRQRPTADRPAMSQITAERLQACAKEYGHQLDGGSWAFGPTVQVDQDGYVIGVHAGEIPNTAPDLAACTREAMRAMAIPGWIFNLRQQQPVASANEPTMAQRTQFGSPAVVVVVVVEVALAELVLEAGAFTILFGVTVQLVDKVADDVVEAARRYRRKPNKNRCLDAAAGGTYLWREFCNSIPDPLDRQDCWSRDMESEENKRGWCNWRYKR